MFLVWKHWDYIQQRQHTTSSAQREAVIRLGESSPTSQRLQRLPAWRSRGKVDWRVWLRDCSIKLRELQLTRLFCISAWDYDKVKMEFQFFGHLLNLLQIWRHRSGDRNAKEYIARNISSLKYFIQLLLPCQSSPDTQVNDLSEIKAMQHKCVGQVEKRYRLYVD